MDGLVGKALNFDGTDDFVSFGVDAGNPGTSSFTATFWVKWTGSGTQGKIPAQLTSVDSNLGGYHLGEALHFRIEGSNVTSLSQLWTETGFSKIGIIYSQHIIQISASKSWSIAKNYVNGNLIG